MFRREFFSFVCLSISSFFVKSKKESDILDSDLLWGTFGKSGTEPLKFVQLRDCTSEHLKAILRTQKQIYGTRYEVAIKAILNFRRQLIPCLMGD